MQRTTTARPISFEQAKSQYVHRFTMEHTPAWAKRSFHQAGTPLDKYPNADKEWPAPHYRTDKEWYDATTFPGEGHLSKRANHCETSGQTWPLGQRLAAPYGETAPPLTLAQLVDAYKASTSRSEQDELLQKMSAHPDHPNNRYSH